VETDDTELIDEMFSRLNEAIALSSAEKRNALGGPIPTFINELANHPFFTSKVSFSNKRYQHKEAAAKLLFLENCLLYHRKIKDTKRAFLDAFVKEYRKRQIQKK
jgi:maltose-binding protein MalE